MLPQFPSLLAQAIMPCPRTGNEYRHNIRISLSLTPIESEADVAPTPITATFFGPPSETDRSGRIPSSARNSVIDSAAARLARAVWASDRITLAGISFQGLRLRVSEFQLANVRGRFKHNQTMQSKSMQTRVISRQKDGIFTYFVLFGSS